jgi:hypothetical protein
MADPIRTYVAPADVPYRDGPSGTLCTTRGGERFAVYDDGQVVEYVMAGREIAESRGPQEIDLHLLEEVGEFRWGIITRMPSTGKLTNFVVDQGTLVEFAQCQGLWADRDCVRVCRVTEADVQALDEESRGN